MCLPSTKQDYVILKGLMDKGRSLSFDESLRRVREESKKRFGTEKFVSFPRNYGAALKDNLRSNNLAIDGKGVVFTTPSGLRVIDIIDLNFLQVAD